jgi:transcriptional regulator with XRE-family HTH domain
MAPSVRKIGKSVHSPEHRAFRALMVEAREKAGLTQHVLAKRLGKPQSFVAKYETGERRLDIIEFIIISRAIKVDPARLLRTLIKKVR